jgi:hypothetical protein
MFIKIGDPNPIVAIIDPIDVDDKKTKKIFRKTVKSIRDGQKVIADLKEEKK